MALQDRRITFIGAGSMAEALIRGLLAAKVVSPDHITGTGRRPERLKELRDRYGVQTSTQNAPAAAGADVVVLSVKPQILPAILRELAEAIPKEALVISIAAGVPLKAIERALGPLARVCRAMPNTPAIVGKGATAFAAGSHVSEVQVEQTRTLFEAVGMVTQVDEALLDAVTGLSGSGPAYVFMIIEALSDAGVKVGLPRYEAQRLAAHTVLGSAHLLIETGEHPGVLKDRVTSPGGTAIAGLHTLEEGGLRTTLINAVVAATARSQELGQAHDEED
jgi:pyrroline-5-carboxylate reductase